MEDTIKFIKTFKDGWEFMNKVENVLGISLHELPVGDSLGKLLDIYLREKFGEGLADYITCKILPIEDHSLNEIKAIIADAIEGNFSE